MLKILYDDAFRVAHVDLIFSANDSDDRLAHPSEWQRWFRPSERIVFPAGAIRIKGRTEADNAEAAAGGLIPVYKLRIEAGPISGDQMPVARNIL
jgi:hypothetical protein